MRTRSSLLLIAGAMVFALAPTPASAATALLVQTPTKTGAVAPAENAIQQSTQDPCIFGNPPCGQNNDSIGTDQGLGHDFPWERTPVSSEDGGTSAPEATGGFLITGDLTDSAFWGNGPGETNDYDGARILVGDLEKVLGAGNDDNFDIGVDINQSTETAGIYTILQFILEIRDGTTGAIESGGAAIWTFTNSAGTPGAIPADNNGTGWSDAILRFPGLDLDDYGNDDYLIFKVSWEGNTDGADNYFINSAIPGPPNVPEPASILLLGSGLVGAANAVRRRRKAQKN